MTKPLVCKTLSEKLEAGSIWVPECGCRIWMRGTFNDGYGCIRWDGHSIRTHRAAWMALHGSIPEEIHVLHTCDVPLCCNPSHLFLGTEKDNAQDRDRKGRANTARGKNSGGPKLIDEQIIFILRWRGTGAELTKMFGVTSATISRIRTRKMWRHIIL